MGLIVEIIGYKGVVGNATYTWLKTMSPQGIIITGRDLGDPIQHYKGDDVVVPFVCVPEAAVDEVVGKASAYANMITIRSTVPPGTCKELGEKYDVHICHLPEFLRESTAVQDEFNMHHLIIGQCCDFHGAMLSDIYRNAAVMRYFTEPIISEFAKIAINNYLACLISFWNEMESIAEAAGVSGHQIGVLAALDPRVVDYGAKWHHQYGGKCLPKEIDQMIKYALQHNVRIPMLRAIREVNNCQTS